jgi:cell division protein FtsW
MSKRSLITLAIAVVGLLMVGFGMLGSAGYYSSEGGGEKYLLVSKQAWALLAGAAVVLACSMINYHRWMTFRWPLLAIAVITLILCYIPGIGHNSKGAWRWIGTESIRVQPSEFAKIALIIVLAAYYALNEAQTRTFWRGFILPSAIAALIVGLIAGEMDLGSAAIVGALSIGIMFVAGAKIRYLPMLGGAAVLLLALMISNNANRKNRVLAFFSDIPAIAKYVDWEKIPPDQLKEIKSKKAQQRHAQLALGSGGQIGVGLGNGRMILYSLPEAHTDFVVAMVGEELGLNGTLWLVLCFSLLTISGMSIAMQAPDHFGRLLAFGITFVLCIQGLVNMGVVTSLLPNKGLVLPFVSYGRSNLLMSMVCIGILCNIHVMGGRIIPSELGTRRGGNRQAPDL